MSSFFSLSIRNVIIRVTTSNQESITETYHCSISLDLRIHRSFHQHPDIKTHKPQCGVQMNDPRKVTEFAKYMEQYIDDHNLEKVIESCNHLLSKQETH